jgi:hypothetical protein
MSEEELGFDRTIMTAKGQRFIMIEWEGKTEWIILDGLMKRARCIAGRQRPVGKHTSKEIRIPCLLSKIHGNTRGALTRASCSLM